MNAAPALHRGFFYFARKYDRGGDENGQLTAVQLPAPADGVSAPDAADVPAVSAAGAHAANTGAVLLPACRKRGRSTRHPGGFQRKADVFSTPECRTHLPEGV